MSRLENSLGCPKSPPIHSSIHHITPQLRPSPRSEGARPLAKHVQYHKRLVVVDFGLLDFRWKEAWYRVTYLLTYLPTWLAVLVSRYLVRILVLADIHSLCPRQAPTGILTAGEGGRKGRRRRGTATGTAAGT
jgi:hypothetical protein